MADRGREGRRKVNTAEMRNAARVEAGGAQEISATHQSTPMNHFPKSSITAQAPDSTPQLLTAEDFKTWLRVSEAAREGQVEQIRRQAVDDLVRYLTREISKGMSLQQAGDAFLSLSKCLTVPFAHTEAARAALVEFGWRAND